MHAYLVIECKGKQIRQKVRPVFSFTDVNESRAGQVNERHVSESFDVLNVASNFSCHF